MDGDGSYVPGSMPAFDRASRTGRFDEGLGGGGGSDEEEDDVGQGYFSKRVRACGCVVVQGCVCVPRAVGRLRLWVCGGV